MITNIKNGIVTVAPHGVPPGKYGIEEFTVEELVIERNLLHTKILYAQKVEPSEKEVAEIMELNKLISQVSDLIDRKIEDN